MCEVPDIVHFVIHVKYLQGSDLRWVVYKEQCFIMR